MDNMHSYLIKSLAPLVFRSGKPFGSQASAQDVIFPLPSAAAGLVRALSIGQDKVEFDTHRSPIKDADYQKLLSIQSGGVFLARVYDDGRSQVLVPKPTNALYFEDKTQFDEQGNAQVVLVRLSPQPFDEGCGSDLPPGLLPVQMQEDLQGKPKSGANFWTLEHLLTWQQGDSLSYECVNDAGLTQLPIELRTHVAIDDETLANVDTALFQTASFDLMHQRMEHKEALGQVWQDHRYAFLVQTEQLLDDDLATFGGERRLSHFTESDIVISQTDLPNLLQHINTSRGFCLTLLTPAIFAQGYLPSWINKDSMEGTLPNSEVKVQLIACAIDRWQAVSGWDSLLWSPKAMRKAVSAGSVYWFELLTDMNETALKQLTHSALSDDIQDKRDGFGRAIITPWDHLQNE